jgi:hypothetical protein
MTVILAVRSLPAPTQAKMFWSNRRWQAAAYGYGPDGNDTQAAYRARGTGALVGATLGTRAVVGLTTRVSKADVFDRRNAGFFARIGFNEHVGVLAEHDITERELSTGQKLTHLAGHTEVFFVPFNWLQTALAAEQDEERREHVPAVAQRRHSPDTEFPTHLQHARRVCGHELPHVFAAVAGEGAMRGSREA